MRTIFLSILIVSSFLSADFSRDSNGIVKDSVTGLFWQDDYTDNQGYIKSAKWEDAINYCERLRLGGYNDWRLPNKKELLSIIDYDMNTPAISSSFQNTKYINAGYWSSTTASGPKGYAWYVKFYWGQMSEGGNKSLSYNWVRCVRGGYVNISK